MVAPGEVQRSQHRAAAFQVHLVQVLRVLDVFGAWYSKLSRILSGTLARTLWAPLGKSVAPPESVEEQRYTLSPAFSVLISPLNAPLSLAELHSPRSALPSFMLPRQPLMLRGLLFVRRSFTSAGISKL